MADTGEMAMNKKQVLSQNAALFAEIERTATETQAMRLRLEEQSEKLELAEQRRLDAESRLEKTQRELERLLGENEELRRENAALCDALRELNDSRTAVPPQTDDAPADPPHTLLQPEPQAENSGEPEPSPAEIEKQQESAENDLPDLRQNDGFSVGRPFVSSGAFPRGTAQDELLRQRGAEAIGTVTRVAVQIISALDGMNRDNAERIQNSVLGKNESFKLEVMSLLASGGEVEAVCAQLEGKTQETVAYLNQIKQNG